LRDKFPSLELVALSGNMCTDKKAGCYQLSSKDVARVLSWRLSSSLRKLQNTPQDHCEGNGQHEPSQKSHRLCYGWYHWRLQCPCQ
jgi:hypothetical protein